MRSMRTTVAIVVLLGAVPAGQGPRPQDVELQAAQRTEAVDGRLDEAIEQYRAITTRYTSDRAVVATALVRMGVCYQKLGDAKARAIYERVVREFGDQQEAVALARTRLQDGARDHTLTYRRVWADSGDVQVDTSGTVSPDGRFLSYVDWNTGNLMLRDLRAGTSRPLTKKGSWVDSEAFADVSAISRDGKQVAYNWFDPETRRAELRVLDLTATGEPKSRMLLARRDVDWVVPLDWSPGGESILAVLTHQRSSTLVLISTTDGAVRTFKTLKSGDAIRAFFSPDGPYIGCSFTSESGGSDEREITLVRTSDGRETKVAEHPGRDLIMGWSPDGSRLLFASDRNGPTGLWAQRIADGAPIGDPELVKADIGHQPLGVTASGALFVGTQVGGRNIYIAEVDFAAGKVVRAPEPAGARFEGLNESPAWSRDGRFLAWVYARNWAGRDAMISIKPLDSGTVRDIPLKLAGGRNPVWAPDGQSFVTQGVDAEGRQGLFKIDAQDGAVSPIVYTPEGKYYFHPKYSPDGRKLYYGSQVDGQNAIVERDMATGAEREVLRRAGIRGVNVSPDGRFLSTIERTSPETYSAAIVIPLDGGAPREVLRVQLPQVFTWAPYWAPDSRQLIMNTFWTKDGKEQRRETWLVPIDGGAPRTLELPGLSWSGVDVHPDGRRVAYHAGELKSEVWVLENFLPPPSRTAKR